jgi:hypothetical protein
MDIILCMFTIGKYYEKGVNEMWLGILLFILAFVIGYILYHLFGGIAVVVTIILLICATIALAWQLNTPTYAQAEYSVFVQGQTFYCNDYTDTWGDNNTGLLVGISDHLPHRISIPNHYYLKNGWLNSWEYCTNPLTIITPAGSNLFITTRTPDNPYILSGSVECK